ncbi:MAG: hypothetical protein IJW55_03745 [Clostridia bacterium]|nr:hypothetical protein [Clostridia bacterium]
MKKLYAQPSINVVLLSEEDIQTIDVLSASTQGDTLRSISIDDILA